MKCIKEKPKNQRKDKEISAEKTKANTVKLVMWSSAADKLAIILCSLSSGQASRTWQLDPSA